MSKKWSLIISTLFGISTFKLINIFYMLTNRFYISLLLGFVITNFISFIVINIGYYIERKEIEKELEKEFKIFIDDFFNDINK